jgi:hypothetical protein
MKLKSFGKASSTLEVKMRKYIVVLLGIVVIILAFGFVFSSCDILSEEEPEVETPSGLYVITNSLSQQILKIGWQVSYKGADLAEKYGVFYRENGGNWTFAGYTNGWDNRFTWDTIHESAGYDYYWWSQGDSLDIRVNAWYGGHSSGYSSILNVTIK